MMGLFAFKEYVIAVHYPKLKLMVSAHCNRFVTKH
jgi:hypothetical protein